MIEQLNHLKAINIVKEIPTEGHSPLLVIAEDYSNYVVKSAQSQNPCTCLINEFFCHYLLKLWQIPTPEIAAIKIDPNILPSNLSISNRKRYFERIAFGSKWIENSVDMNEFMRVPKMVDYRKIYNPQDILLLGLFDIWVENDDRKPTNNNIIFSTEEGRLTIMAIDHAYTFSTLNHEELNPIHVSSSYNDSIILTPLGQIVKRKIINGKSWLPGTRNYFYFCIEKCERYFDEICDKIPKPLGFDLRLQNIMRNFLFDKERNKQVFNEFLVRIK